MGSSSSRNVEASQVSPGRHRSRRERGHASDACFFNRRHNSENTSGHGRYQENCSGTSIRNDDRLDEASTSRWESRLSGSERTQFESGSPPVPVQSSAEGSQLLQGSDGSFYVNRSENRRITGGVINEPVDSYLSNAVESESRANALLVENCQSTRSSLSLESKVSEGDDIEISEECEDAISKETRSSDVQRKVEVESGTESIVEVSTSCPWSSSLRGDIAACSSVECATTSSSSEAESHLSEDDAFRFTTPSSYQDNIEPTDQSSHLPEESTGRIRTDTSSRESRRNSGRRFWDALTRAASHRRSSAPITIVAIEEIDDHGSSTSRWNLQQWRGFSDSDQSGGFSSARTVDLEERRRHVRSQVWALQRLSGGLQVSHGHARSCPAAGHHPSGPCSCETHTLTEDSSTRASISRIIMLAEALFEVLDEIHRQSVALSRTMPLSSLPAPDAVVDSIPIRLYKKFEVHTEPCEEAAQCYICLIEYEEGDQIRVLPCHHEYHKACVDKWLKEVHRVCPLCRGDVCESDSNTGNAEIPSL